MNQAKTPIISVIDSLAGVVAGGDRTVQQAGLGCVQQILIS